jgi:hypothetical protein
MPQVTDEDLVEEGFGATRCTDQCMIDFVGEGEG